MILTVGSGFLGSYVLRTFAARTREPILGTVRDLDACPAMDGVAFTRCDVTQAADLKRLAALCAEQESLTVFYFAAMHQVDAVFAHPAEAEKVNVAALRSFFSAMPPIDKLFFASTDCVYGENPKDALLTEAAPLHPVNCYGRQKCAAERIVLDHGYTCVRLPFMIGPSLTAKPHFYDRIRQTLAAAQPVEMIDGMVRNVLSYAQVAELLYACSQFPAAQLPPVLNISGDDCYTKYEIGRRLAHAFGADPALIRKISEEEGQKFFRDRRAAVSVMDNRLLKSLLGKETITWEVAAC